MLTLWLMKVFFISRDLIGIWLSIKSLIKSFTFVHKAYLDVDVGKVRGFLFLL